MPIAAARKRTSSVFNADMCSDSCPTLSLGSRQAVFASTQLKSLRNVGSGGRPRTADLGVMKPNPRKMTLVPLCDKVSHLNA